MKPVLDVPFLADETYVNFLADKRQELSSVHFSILSGKRLDSRFILGPPDNHAQVIEFLSALHGVKRYALMNSLFYTPDLLISAERLQPIIYALDECCEHGVINGIIFCDQYLLQRLSSAAPGLASALEAVPGVNTMLDSLEKVEAQLACIGETHFRLPSQLVLDRSLNRDLDRLARVALQVRGKFPEVNLGLLANEGCLPYCPFKASHDAYIALANMEGQDSTYSMNCELGCMRLLEQQPHRVLQSPFIRPEDVDLYLYHVDTIKLCGRTLGADFLCSAIQAYCARQYEGNLLNLMDATHWMADRLYVDNGSLSFDFANMLSMCDSRCEVCGFCEELFESITRPLPFSLEDRRPRLIDSKGTDV
ncbi:MAG: hypothetical protein CSA34_05580 [Desulfobulbus propionicus]|nr:MAG: hypothetical protein CSA34_05580 [Desulfobulbus propionicus]